MTIKSQAWGNRMRLASYRNASLLCLALIALTGCSNQPQTYKVSGRVQFPNGSPVKVGVVEFLSPEHSLNARGNINKDGTFTLTTFNEGDGAVAGEHKCVVLQMIIGENMKGFGGTKLGVVDPKFGSYSTSELTAVVEENDANNIVLQIEGIVEQPPEGTEHNHKH